MRVYRGKPALREREAAEREAQRKREVRRLRWFVAVLSVAFPDPAVGAKHRGFDADTAGDEKCEPGRHPGYGSQHPRATAQAAKATAEANVTRAVISEATGRGESRPRRPMPPRREVNANLAATREAEAKNAQSTGRGKRKARRHS